MDSTASMFATKSTHIALPGYRWVQFITHQAKQPVSAATPRQVLELIVADPAFTNEYFGFGIVDADSNFEVVHGPYLVKHILSEDFIEVALQPGIHPVIHAILQGSGVYKNQAPEPSAELLECIHAYLADIPEGCSYFFLQLEINADQEKVSEIGWIFAEYSQHFFVSPTTCSIHVVTIACE